MMTSKIKMGTKSTCKQCDKEIEYIGPMWRHTTWTPRHIALPKEEEPQPVLYRECPFCLTIPNRILSGNTVVLHCKCIHLSPFIEIENENELADWWNRSGNDEEN